MQGTTDNGGPDRATACPAIASQAKPDDPTHAMLAAYGRALATLSETPHEEHADVLRTMSLDPTTFAELSKRGDEALDAAIRDNTLEALVVFKASFDAARDATIRRRSAPKPKAARPAAATAPPLPRASSLEKGPPSRSPLSVNKPRLSLMQYAALRAELAGAPESAASSIHARFGLDAREVALESIAWHFELATNGALFDEYARLFTYFRGLRRR